MNFVSSWVNAGVEKAFESWRSRVSAPIEIELWDGRVFSMGPEPSVRMKVRDADALTRLLNPTLGSLAEAYVEGDFDIDGSMSDIVLAADRLTSGAGAFDRIAHVPARHTRKVDKESVRRHYDVSNDFYRLWLDRRMVYSCAYFKDGTEDIDTAQVQKLDHVCRKLQLKPGERLLDIGCGWGGLIIHAASNYGVDATGITLSENQYTLAKERIRESGLEGRSRVELIDYRDIKGEGLFDKVASIGMFEHVGLRNLPVYFGAVKRLLKERGLYLNHGITSSDVENREVGSDTGGFISKYVFPHGELPHVALAVREMSAQGFEVVDVESLRMHYARTLALWSDRLESELDAASRTLHDKALRVWRVYLTGCSYGFAQGWMSIYQILASKQTNPGPNELPWTRDYMYR